MPEIPRGVTFQVPVAITAKTADELTVAMLQQNIKDGIKYGFFDIQKAGKEWVAWYVKDVGRMVMDQLDKEKLDGRGPELP